VVFLNAMALYSKNELLQLAWNGHAN
jgi:hypothetical protein